MVDVSVVIASWKMKDMLRAMLHSIRQFTHGIEYELIVIDNNSKDGTSQMLRDEFPEVRLIENSANRGVAPARNQGFRIARGRYVVTLDADMLFLENSLKLMMDFMDTTPDAGICGCKLVNPDLSIQPSGRRFPTLLAFVFRRLEFLAVVRNSRILRHHEMSDWDRSDTRRIDYLIGACQFIRRAAMDDVGFLDDKIFYGPEDIDYCLRMQKNGWRVYFYSQTQIIHYEQRITKKRLFTKISFLHLMGIVYLYIKHNGKLAYD